MVTKPPTGAEPPPEPVLEPRPVRRFTDTAAGRTTTLHSGLRIVGQLSGMDSVDLSGTLEGDSEIVGLFRVRETARVKGNIVADQVLIEGEVEGDQILARQKVVLGPRAKVRADIETTSLALAEGSFLDGRVHMREGGAGPVSYQERRTGEGHPPEAT
jgi:cytoskeletal protein CcmA (bactofilin family)